MAQVRMNNVAVCHIHQDKLENIEICQQFISVTERHRHVFGSYKQSKAVHTELFA